jgi:hypothetical protein
LVTVLVIVAIGHRFYWSLFWSALYWSALLLVSVAIGRRCYWSALLLVGVAVGQRCYLPPLLLVTVARGRDQGLRFQFARLPRVRMGGFGFTLGQRLRVCRNPFATLHM